MIIIGNSIIDPFQVNLSVVGSAKFRIPRVGMHNPKSSGFPFSIFLDSFLTNYSLSVLLFGFFILFKVLFSERR